MWIYVKNWNIRANIIQSHLSSYLILLCSNSTTLALHDLASYSNQLSTSFRIAFDIYRWANGQWNGGIISIQIFKNIKSNNKQNNKFPFRQLHFRTYCMHIFHIINIYIIRIELTTDKIQYPANFFYGKTFAICLVWTTIFDLAAAHRKMSNLRCDEWLWK